MSQVARLHISKTRTVGGRENGTARSSDGRLDVRFAVPGAARIGTNPEQLFAAAWSASFESALALAAQKRKISLPSETVIDAEVDLSKVNESYFLSAKLNVSLPNLHRDIAQSLIEEAKAICPYSKATHGNIEVAINLI